MKKPSKRNDKNTKKSLLRKNRVTFVLNDKELNALEAYCKRFRVKNKSRFVRTVLMSTVIERLEQSSPTLFD
ncbi:MAG: hypothetical protein KA995_05675 [Paludibacteraceae bacterium]|nr:hypothetical protein [Paludibacteraceae bacterium]